MTTPTTTTRQLLPELATPPPGADQAPSLEEARKRPGTIAEVTEEDYFSYLEMLPPHFMDGSFFCFAEGAEPYLLFWRSGPRYYARQLTWEETKRLAELAGIPLPGDW